MFTDLLFFLLQPTPVVAAIEHIRNACTYNFIIINMKDSVTVIDVQ